jgi:hypothetical protein
VGPPAEVGIAEGPLPSVAAVGNGCQDGLSGSRPGNLILPIRTLAAKRAGAVGPLPSVAADLFIQGVAGQ